MRTFLLWPDSEGITCWNLGLELVNLDRLVEGIPLLGVYVYFLREIGHPNADSCTAYVEELRRRLES